MFSRALLTPVRELVAKQKEELVKTKNQGQKAIGWTPCAGQAQVCRKAKKEPRSIEHGAFGARGAAETQAEGREGENSGASVPHGQGWLWCVPVAQLPNGH